MVLPSARFRTTRRVVRSTETTVAIVELESVTISPPKPELSAKAPGATGVPPAVGPEVEQAVSSTTGNRVVTKSFTVRWTVGFLNFIRLRVGCREAYDFLMLIAVTSWERITTSS